MIKEKNKTLIKDFTGNKYGKKLEIYLKEAAIDQDKAGITKVYLVKDISSGKIVFYFALNCGLLIRPYGQSDLPEEEEEIVTMLIEALNGNGDISVDDILSWSEEPVSARLLKIAEERRNYKADVQADIEHTQEEKNALRVLEQFPAIELSHFCKNADYRLSMEIDIPLGFYVFWEMVVPEVLKIATMVGCQYIYLFAADSSDNAYYIVSDYDLKYGDFEDEMAKEIDTYELVEYYKNELKVREVQNMTIVKPAYDNKCFSLVQSIGILENNRILAWEEHSDVAEN